MALTTDPIISAAEAQKIFDVSDEEELFRLVNGLSAKAKAFLGRVQLNESLTSVITENFREVHGPTIYLHAPVNTSDFSTYDVTAKIYYDGVLSETYSANDVDLVVTSDDYSARIDLVGGYFPCTGGADFIKVEYYGGWETIPGDIYAGAVMQGRVDLERMNGNVGYSSSSQNGQSIGVDQAGIVTEVAQMWQLYRMLV